MRQPPKDVTPVVHQGIRYEAPHHSLEADDGAERLRVISTHLEKAMRSSMVGGKMIDPQDSGWLKEALKDCPVPQSEIDAFLDLMAFQAAVAPVMMRVTQKLLSQPLPQGLPNLESHDMRQALEEDGTLTPLQIDRVLGDITGAFGNPTANTPHGGRLAAYDQVSNEKLWELQVYHSKEDLFITELRLEGDDLIVLDEFSREHRIDLKDRRVCPL